MTSYLLYEYIEYIYDTTLKNFKLKIKIEVHYFMDALYINLQIAW